MSNQDFDPFAPSTGLPDDFDCVVKAAWFEFDPDFANGQNLVLKMTFQTDIDDFSSDGPTGDVLFSTGKGWTTNDRGATAVRDDGKNNKGFHQSTAYHMWIDGAIKCDGAEKVLRSAERGDPRVAAMWVGTAWHVNAKPVDYGVIDGQNVGVRNKLVPSKFLGVASDLRELSGGAGDGNSAAPAKAAGPVTKAPPAKAAAAVKKAAPAPAAQAAAPGLDAELRAQLKAIAMAADTHEQFVEQAFELAAVSEDEAVSQAVMDGGEGSIWAEAVAEYQAANG